MTCLWHALLSIVTLGGAAWVSNVWPGIESWPRAAVSRLLWWGMPFALIASLNGAPWDHAAYLGAAAWLGAWIPHTAMPDVHSSRGAMVTDLVLVVVRVAALLALPAGVFWLCGAWWFAMVGASAGVIPCILVGNTMTLPWRGVSTPRHIAGVLFGASTGLWLTVAIMTPAPLRDWLLP